MNEFDTQCVTMAAMNPSAWILSPATMAHRELGVFQIERSLFHKPRMQQIAAPDALGSVGTTSSISPKGFSHALIPSKHLRRLSPEGGRALYLEHQRMLASAIDTTLIGAPPIPAQLQGNVPIAPNPLSKVAFAQLDQLVKNKAFMQSLRAGVPGVPDEMTATQQAMMQSAMMHSSTMDEMRRQQNAISQHLRDEITQVKATLGG